ncbi:MAG: hypothetical protein J5I57_09200 [Melioribacteraceae bacterium]|nr:hypothetical protein [Melioribacteraceae bacterium]
MRYIIILCILFLVISCSTSSKIQRETQFSGSIVNFTTIEFNSIDLLNKNSIGELLPFEYVKLNMEFERGSLNLDLGVIITLNYIGSQTSPVLGKFDYDIYIMNELLRKGEYKNPFDFLKHDNSILLDIRDRFELPENFYEDNLKQTLDRFIELTQRNKSSIFIKLYNFHSLLDSTIIKDTLFINSELET